VSAVRRIAFSAGLAALLVVTLAAADEIDVRDVALRAVEDGLVVDANFEFELNARLAEVVSSGVPLYFRVDFELTRRRWYWFDDTASSRRLQLRLSYHALSRQYRLSTGLLQQNFSSLDEALNVLKRVRNWLVVDRTVTFADADYEAAVRMRLSALTSRELQLESPWHRFTVRSPQQTPAPVESREPSGARR
jgi:hypothetical protein